MDSKVSIGSTREGLDYKKIEQIQNTTSSLFYYLIKLQHMPQKKIVFLLCTHHYLFRATGVYYLNKLKESSDIYVFMDRPGFSEENIDGLEVKGFFYYRGFRDFLKLFHIMREVPNSNDVTILSPNFSLRITYHIAILAKILFRKVNFVEYLNAARVIDFDVD